MKKKKTTEGGQPVERGARWEEMGLKAQDHMQWWIAMKRKKNLLLLTAIDSVAPDNWGFRGYLSHFFLMK